MTLYTSDDSGLPQYRRAARESPAVRRWRWGSGLIAGAVVLTVALTAVPAPYVIEQPGPTFNTLGTVSVTTEDSDSRSKVPLITVAGATTYPTQGNLNLLTVNVLGVPGSLPSWGDIILAWFDPAKAVVPVDSVFPPNESKDERDKQSATLMVNSQQDAIAAALTHEGYDVVSGIEVAGFAEGSQSEGILQVGDVITEIDGVVVKSVQELRDELADAGAGTMVTLLVTRSGRDIPISLAPYENDNGDVVLGIGATVRYEFPFDVTIRLDDVGGPSAGMMFALGIIDKLTPGNLNSGLNISGTGTIDNLGNVGPIGGIRQKMYGAVGTDSSFFLAPAENCSEVVGHVPSGLAVFATSTLDESLRILQFLSTHQDVASALSDSAGAGIRTCDSIASSAIS